MKDIYFLREWQKLYAERSGYRLDSISFSCPAGAVEYAFGRRSIEIRGEKFPYEDIVTPYAFSGPQLMPKEESAKCKEELAREFDQYFQEYCRREGIVAEFVQFNPWFRNHEPFADIYRLDFRSHVVGIDLAKKDLLMDELSARRRRAVRSAIKQGVQICYDTTGEKIDEFLRLYEFTVQKYDATDYYRFDRRFIQSMFERLQGYVSFAYAIQDGRCVSMCMLLSMGKYLHYHLAANDPEMLHLNGSSLLIYDVACKAQREGYELFVLGGAEGAMMEFKQTFTRDCYFDYYSGKRIRNQEVYDRLVKINGIRDTAFFPAYRDNGKVQYMNWLKEEDKNER